MRCLLGGLYGRSLGPWGIIAAATLCGWAGCRPVQPTPPRLPAEGGPPAPARPLERSPSLRARIVAFDPGPGRFPLAERGVAAALWVAEGDFPGVLRVAGDLATDIERVTGTRPALTKTSGALPDPGSPSSPARVVLLGTLGRSPLLDRLVAEGKLDVRGIEGRWETSLQQVVDDPLPGIAQALVLAGSDQRGTIYSAYDVSRQIGVSPWHYWDDVPVRHREGLFVLPGRHTQGEPRVKYRGIFINDEAPALSTWAQRTFGPAPNPKAPQGFNQQFYAKVYEVLLRLRGNYLWPAVWGRSLFDDDPENQALAANYGIVMGTSHEAPMMRAQDEWDRYGGKAGPYGGNGAFSFVRNEPALRRYWADGIRRNRDYEALVTVGMRGNGDLEMEDAQGIELMNRIVTAQREILRQVTGKEPEDTPQVWTLYKEVQRYWEEGMRAPEDVTIVWCDDNWGNLRGLPGLDEPPRRGGYGIYYHFDYVGGGRSYKWVDTNLLPNVWEQLHRAYRHGVKQVWMVNVGDLKNVEQPLEFFLDYAWDPEQLPLGRLPEWERAWAETHFGPEHAPAIAGVASGYHHLQSRRKPELLNRLISLDPARDLTIEADRAVIYTEGSPFSLVHYGEAERIVAEWQGLARESARVRALLRPEQDDAYYQLVHYAVVATANLYELRLAQFQNLLYAKQGRAIANDVGKQAEAHFRADQALSHYYNHQLAGGKWEGFQTQPKIGYGGPYPDSSWQQPQRDNQAIADFIWPPLTQITVPPGLKLGVAVTGSEEVFPRAKVLTLPGFSPYQTQPTQHIEIFRAGSEPFAYEIREQAPWLEVLPASGMVDSQVRAQVTVDFARVPPGTTEVPITVSGPAGQSALVRAIVHKPPLDGRVLSGFIEANGYVSFEAEHFDRNLPANGIAWTLLPGIGRTGSGLTPFPVTARRQDPAAGSPRLEYDFEVFHAGTVRISAYLSPRLPAASPDGLKYAIAVDDAPPQVVDTTQALSSLPPSRGWERNTSDNINLTVTSHQLSRPGHHVLKFIMVDSGVVAQKFVIDTGGLAPSALGPPESFHAD